VKAAIKKLLLYMNVGNTQKIPSGKGLPHILLTLMCVWLWAFNSHAQPNNFQVPNTIPAFNILLCDGKTYFNADNLEKNKGLMIVYFDPDCDHCKKFSKTVVANRKQFNNMQLLFICASNQLSLISKFSTETGLQAMPNVKIGTEGIYHATMNFYRVEITPFIALYNSAGKLLQIFRNIPTVPQIMQRLKN
jgi:thioredoxin-related protein